MLEGDRTWPGALGNVTRGGEDRACSSMNLASRDCLGGKEPRTTTHPGPAFHYLSPHTLPSTLLPAMLGLCFSKGSKVLLSTGEAAEAHACLRLRDVLIVREQQTEPQGRVKEATNTFLEHKKEDTDQGLLKLRKAVSLQDPPSPPQK